MHSSSWRLSLLALLAMLGTAVTAAELKPTPDVLPTWKEFWASVRVEPAPPKNFLEGLFTGRVDNLTQGKISDETARKWVLANLRRGRGDAYAGQHLRDDIANAGIFGPPGLNGTSEQIQSMRAKNIDHIEKAGHLDMLAVGVIAVPRQVQRENPHLALTDFVIVQLYRRPTGPIVTVFRDGRRETAPGPSGERLHWQIDTGHFFRHPTLGPLWYQKMGWSCVPDDSVLGQLCGQVRP